MNLGMIILGTIMVAICVLPFVAVSISRRNVKKGVEKSLRTLLSQNNASATKEEFIGNKALALDENQGMLFFIKNHSTSSESFVVKMNEMKSCKLDKESRTVASERGSYLLVESLVLRLTPALKGAKEVQIPIFKIEDDLHLNDELALAERWSAIIDEQLRLRVPVPAGANQNLPLKRFKATA